MYISRIGTFCFMYVYFVSNRTHCHITHLKKKVKFFFENFSKYFLKIFFKNCPMVAKWRFMTFGKKKFFENFFYLISSLFFQMHKVRMCVVWHKIKIHATKCPYPRNVQIPFLWPKCLYYCHINRSKYTKIERNTL